MNRAFWLLLLFPVFFEISEAQELVLQVEPQKLIAAGGELVKLKFTIINRSKELISTSRNYFLSYHLYDSQGNLIKFDNRRWSLSVKVFPGRVVSFQCPVFFNHPPGRYRLQWEVLREGHFWGKERGWKADEQNLELIDLFRSPPQLGKTIFQQEIKSFFQLELLVQQTLKNSVFLIRPKLSAFAAGSDYPQFWVRDFASIIGVAAEYYSSEQIEQLLQFLILNFSEYGPADWFDQSGKSGLNSVASDQETSLILAVGEYFRHRPDWILKNDHQKILLNRLDRIMDSFLKRCYDRKIGLIRSGYTIDWGDVSLDFSDQRALQLDVRSKISYNLFYQARALRAALVLEELARKTGYSRLVVKWKEFYDKLKRNLRKKFILGQKNYLAIRYLPEGLPPVEEKILAVGGNCEAILAGVLNKNEQQDFCRELFRRQEELKLFSGSFTLLPPYPQGYFLHHLVRSPYSYQNGGLWDWIGSRLLEVLFRNDYHRQAVKFQEEIINRTLREMTFWEWYDLEGKARGAFSYTASAGELFRIILENKRGAFSRQ